MSDGEDVAEVLNLVLAEAARASPAPPAEILALRAQITLRSRGIVVPLWRAGQLLVSAHKKREVAASID